MDTDRSDAAPQILHGYLDCPDPLEPTFLQDSFLEVLRWLLPSIPIFPCPPFLPHVA